MKQIVLESELRDVFDRKDTESLRKFCEETHPATVADLIGEFDSEEIWEILHLLSVHHRAEIFSRLNLERQVELATGERRGDMARLLEEMEPDERADLVQRLDDSVREEILPLVARAEREDIRRLVSYEEGTVGSVMTTDYAVLRPDLTVSQAIDALRRQAPGKETIYYIYVVDAAHRLLGLVSLRELILARPTEVVANIMTEDVITVPVSGDQEEVAAKIEKFDLLAIPVLDPDNRLVGIVTHDDAIDILRQEQQEDVEKFMAIAGAHSAREYISTPVWRHFSNRVVWIVPLAFFGLISGLIIERHSALLGFLPLLAAFIPMLSDSGGNTGSQSATLVIRALALGEITPRDFLKVAFKEVRIAVLLGCVLALVAFARVWVFGAGSVPASLTVWQVGMAVSFALGLQIVTATLAGATLPLLAAKLRVDPALVASPALTTVVDITGVFIFFTVTQAMLAGFAGAPG